MAPSKVSVKSKDYFREEATSGHPEGVDKDIRTIAGPNVRTFDRTLTRTLTRTYCTNPKGKPKAKLLFVTQRTDLCAHY
jgi:hypothetical protein